ncbi:MAG: hypothetical protein KIG88_08955 [Weeksellaceae bacterium]|nr:hypothetical protein [Weeksellaceae bacterium]
MKQKIKQRILVFFSSIILLLPIINALHFVLIDHTVNQDSGIIKIPHQCDDFILNQTYIIHDFTLEIEKPIWLDFYYHINVNYLKNYQSKFLFDINNKGPPNSNLA